MPVMEKSLGLTKTDLALVSHPARVAYGVAKFINGFFGDRCNARTFMVAGLLLSAMLNVFFGFSSTVVALARIFHTLIASSAEYGV